MGFKNDKKLHNFLVVKICTVSQLLYLIEIPFFNFLEKESEFRQKFKFVTPVVSGILVAV